MSLGPALMEAIIVVLGQSLNPDGTPPETLLKRASKAAEIYHESGGRYSVITTGGDPIRTGTSEAAHMRRVLLDCGVLDSSITMESESLNTCQNAWLSAPLFPEGVRRVLLVTSDFHMPRAAYIFEAVLKARGLEVEVEQFPTSDGCPAKGLGQLNVSALDINKQSRTERLQNEARFIQHEVVQVGLKEHIPGLEIAPLSDVRLGQALNQVLQMIKAERPSTPLSTRKRGRTDKFHRTRRQRNV